MLWVGLQAQVGFDQNYAVQGLWKYSLADAAEIIHEIKLDASGKIIAVGITSDDNEAYKNRIVIFRLNNNGTLDNTWGIDGKVFIDDPAASDEASGILVQPDGKIVVAGVTNVIYPVLYRLTTNGSRDNSFGTNGKMQMPSNVHGKFNCVTLQPDGKIVAAGYAFVDNGNHTDYLVARFNASNGALDNTFDGDGWMFLDIFNDDWDGAQKVKIDANNNIVLCGYSESDGTSSYANTTLARIKPNGQPDPNFGFGGYWYTTSGLDDFGRDMVILADGTILMVGQLHSSSKSYASLWRFDANGQFKEIYLTYINGIDDDAAYAISLQCDGKILITAVGNTATAIFRLNTDYSYDTSFGNNGFFISQIGFIDLPRSMVIYGEKIYIGGQILPSSNSFTNYDFLIARLNNPITAQPTITASGPTIFCNGGSVTLTAQGVPNGVQPTWSNGQIGASIIVTQSGTYSATYTSACGPSAPSNTILVTVTPTPTNTPTITAQGSTTPCPGGTVTLVATGGSTYVWSNGQTGASITVSATTIATNYTVSISNGNCYGPPSNPIIVIASTPPNATPAITASGPTALCPGDGIVLNVNNQAGSWTTVWSPGGQIGVSLAVHNAGSYSARFQNADGCFGPTSSPIIVSSLPMPTAPGIQIVNGDALLCPGETVTLAATNICTQCTISWQPSNQNGNTLVVDAPGNYTAVAENTCGFSSSTPMIINTVVVVQPDITITNICHLGAPSGTINQRWYQVVNGNSYLVGNGPVYTVTQTGYYFLEVTDINGCQVVSNTYFVQSCISDTWEGINLAQFTIFPNPATTKLHIQMLPTETIIDARLEILTSDGRLLEQHTCQMMIDVPFSLDIAVEQWPSGIYYYRLVSAQGSASGQFMVR